MQRRRRAAALAALLAAALPPAAAFESDVHYGLTRWLALRAGFEASHAEAVAVHNQRVDGGMIETQTLNLEYACAGRLDGPARQHQAASFPAAKAVPAVAVERAVVAGGDAARRALAALMAQASGKEGLLAGKLGEALHPLQDSWSHQGVPSAPDFGGVLECDSQRFSGPPAARGGAMSHAASLTARAPAETLAMAKASYDALVAYPPIEGRARRPAPWSTLEPLVAAFAKADTKTAKRAWFVAQGIADTGFLEGTSLPDGPEPGLLRWQGRKLLALPGAASTQHDAPVEARAFFDRLLARWLGEERIEDIVAEFARPPAGATKAEAARGTRELVARLKLWKLRDHGAAAALAHAPAPLTAAQLRAVDALVRAPRAFVGGAPGEAVFPLLPVAVQATPLVPYIVRPLPDADGRRRVVAILRFRHAPYDSVGWIAEHDGTRWALVAQVAAVDQ